MSTTIGGVRIADMPDLGAFNDSSSVVGERAGSGRFSAPQLRSYITAGLPWVNVRDWGAKGDGLTDDTAAFNAALASIAGVGGNGKLIIPAGNYKITGPLTYPSGYLHVEGAGPGSVLSLFNPTSDLFTFAGTNITLSDFRVLTPYQTSTHGGLFNFLNASNIRLDKVSTDGGFGVVQFLGAPGALTYRTNITNCHFVNVMNNAVFYDPYFGGLGMISDTEMLAAPNNTGGNGIIIEAGDTFTFTNINIQGFPEGIEVVSKTGGINYAANLFAANVLCDGGGNPAPNLMDGWIFNGSMAGTYVARIHLSGCWAGAMGRHGFYVLNASDVTFSNCIGIANGGHGFLVVTPCSDITLDGCTAMANSAGAANVNDGIHIAGPVTDFIITGCRSKPDASYGGGPAQRYGVFIDGSANNRYIVTGNNLNGNVTAGLADTSAGSPTRFVSQNII